MSPVRHNPGDGIQADGPDLGRPDPLANGPDPSYHAPSSHDLIQAINRMLAASAAAPDEESLCRRFLTEAAALTGAALGWAGESREKGPMKSIALFDAVAEDANQTGGQEILLKRGLEAAELWIEVRRTGEPLLINHPGGHPAFADWPAGSPPPRNFLGLPLRRAGAPVGLIALADKPGIFTPEDLATAASLMPALSEGLAHFRLRQELEQYRGRLGVLVGERTAELEAAGGALLEEKQRLELLLDAHPEIIYVVDPKTYEVLFANKALCEQMGEDPHGKLCYEVFQGFKEPCPFCTREGVELQEDQPHRWRHHNTWLDRHYDITDLLIPWHDGRLVKFELAVDITEQVHSANHLQAAMETTPDGYLLLDGAGQIRICNKGLVHLLGFSRTQIQGMNFADLQTGEAGLSLKRILAIIKDESSGTFETNLRDRNDRSIDVEVGGTYLPVEGGCYHVFVRDIRERVQFAEERARHVRALTRSNEELEEFAYLASHDLQEPLRKILAFGDRLSGLMPAEAGEKAQDYLERVLSSAYRMRTLINDLLTYSRLASQGRPFERVDLAEVCAGVLEDLEMALAECSGEIEYNGLPAIDADPAQIHSLFFNLIGNSLKFRRPDVAPRIRIQSRKTGSMVRIVFADNGIGIDPRFKERIFQIFQRLHGPQDYEGTGIGLAVCRKIAERHQGTITLGEGSGPGAVFVVTLPIVQTNQEVEARCVPTSR